MCDAPNWHSNVGIDKGIMKVKVRGVPKLRSSISLWPIPSVLVKLVQIFKVQDKTKNIYTIFQS